MTKFEVAQVLGDVLIFAVTVEAAYSCVKAPYLLTGCFPLCQIFRIFQGENKWSALVRVENFLVKVVQPKLCHSIFKHACVQFHLTEKTEGKF